MSDIIFKSGDNSPYATCNVILCPFWTAVPQKLGRHMMKVHHRSIEQSSKMVKEFIDFYLENGGDHKKINIFDSNYNLRNDWKMIDSEIVESIVEMLNEYEMKTLGKR